MAEKNRFKNDSGALLLKGIFFETQMADKSSVVYTLKDRDHEGFPSLYRLYMEANDPTEYKFATTCLDGWEHWERLSACNWFKPYIEAWRRELEVRMKSQALQRIMSEAKTNSRESFNANKYLLEKGWEPKDGQSKRGRPSKEEIKAEAINQANLHFRLDSDFDRISGSRN